MCRKGYFAINPLIFSGFDRRIYDMVINVPGSYHDAATWRMSMMKPYLENLDPKAVVLGQYFDNMQFISIMFIQLKTKNTFNIKAPKNNIYVFCKLYFT